MQSHRAREGRHHLDERFMLAVARPWSSPVIELIAEQDHGGRLVVTRTRAGTEEILDTSSHSGVSGRPFRGGRRKPDRPARRTADLSHG